MKKRERTIRTMEINIIFKTFRCVTFEINDGGIYNTTEVYKVYLNNQLLFETDKVINSLYNLIPDNEYVLVIRNQKEEIIGSTDFTTPKELFTIDVKELGAYGDGIHDDTSFIQAAFMMSKKGVRVLIPKGEYKITSLFLTSDLTVELEKGAHLMASVDRNERVRFPGSYKTTDENDDECHYGTWEGNPFPMFAGIITGINVSDITIYGEGILDGMASNDNWWKNPKVMNIAYRPRMIFLNRCNNVTVQGIKVTNSPAWNIHPFFSENLLFCDMFVENPKISPNTDGLDPESCKNVDIVGLHFSLGDDCIAVKSGKFYMGQKYKTPSDNIHIRQCLMENGHGAVTLGSEIAGGVTNLLVEKCLFRNTDRGLRIKTRRGRGRQCFLDNIMFRDIKMDSVMSPFTVNMFYFCDPDGHEEYVQSREKYPVDERTPRLGLMTFENIEAKNAHVCAAYFLGLPEEKIEAVHMKNVNVDYSENAMSDLPVMCDGIEPMTKKGIVAINVKELILENVNVNGQDGEEITADGVDNLVKR